MSENPQNDDTTNMIHQQLRLISHSHSCMLRENFMCLRQNCLIFQDVIDHLKKCDLSEKCVKPFCSSTRKIINHWNFCSKLGCKICWTLKKSGEIFLMPKLCDHYEVEFDMKVYLNQSNDQDFRELIFNDVREFLANKLAEALDARTNSNPKDLLSYARKREDESYQKATSRNEYFHLLGSEMLKVKDKNFIDFQAETNENQEVLPQSDFKSKLINLSAFHVREIRKISSEVEELNLTPEETSKYWIHELSHACQCTNKYCKSTTCERLKSK